MMPEDTTPRPLNEQPPLRIAVKKEPHTLRWLLVGFGALLIVAGGATWWLTKRYSAPNTQQSQTTNTSSQQSSQQTNTQDIAGLRLDTAKNYGDKYADGILPVGDSKYSTNGTKKGYIYSCNANFVPATQAGAQTRGPWFINNNTQWDSKKKVAVQGNITWQQSVTIAVENDKRVVTTNDLPDHHTGVFPVAKNDPARSYDANPNSISSQSLVYNLAANPTYGQPQCMGGEAGIMINGVALFSAFDAGGRDAGAWEVQDTCDGHPQNKGEYHYHTLSRCIKDTSVQTVIGYALDGFPITGPKIGQGNILTTDDLDECHGIVSEVLLDNKKTTTYHYVMTQDFPYSISCFRATAIQPPGQHETTGTGQQRQGTQGPTQPRP
jgi:hypothetical protein